MTIDGEEYWTVQTAAVEPFGVIEIESAEATKVNEIEVVLANPVDPDEVAVTVVRGTNTVNVEDLDWSDDYDTLTITTSANMSEGIYTVTITDIEGETNTDSAVFEVEGRKVTEIIITNDIAYTSTDKTEAYAYYDVLDQYGESMRKSASVQWTGSCTPTANKTTGKITLTKTAGVWTYNDQIYLTGVYTKTGVTCQKTLTVGTEQSMDRVELKGFVKKGTSTILESLPASFTDNTYYLIYTTVDQNGDALPVGQANGAVTFVSDNVLVVDEIGTPIENGLVIAGDEYEASFVSPGIKVADGGEVTITAIATKTGTKSELTFDVTETAVIQSFSFAEPSGVVADGDQDVKIPFTALDVDGNEVTDFDTIAKQRTFNELTLNASEGTLELKEEDDGTATLLWSDRALTWNGDSFNGIDRPVNLSAVVVGGDSDNIMLSVQDARRPDTIAAIDTNSVEVEGAAIPFSLASFSYYDQYGDLIGDDFGDDNGFFEYAKANIAGSSNTDFNGYTFGVRVKYAGSNNLTYDTTAAAGTVYANNTPGTTTNQLVIVSNATTTLGVTTPSTSAIGFKTKTTIDDVATGEGFKYEIVKTNVNTNKADGKAANWESASPEKYSPLTVVDITQLKNLTITELPMLYLGEAKNNASSPAVITGSGVMAATGNITDTVGSVTGGLTADGDYTKTVEVTGTYEGESVTVPESYYHVFGSKISDGLDADAGIATPGTGFDGKLDSLVAGGLKAEHLYDKTTANYTSKNTTDTVKAQVQKIYGKTTRAVAFYKDATAATTDSTALSPTTDTYTFYTTVAPGSTTADLYTAYAAANAYIDSTASLTNFKTTNVADIKAALKALNKQLLLGELVFDTASTTVTLSDQAPKNAAIENVADAYTLNPTLTKLGTGEANDMLALLDAEQDDAIEVVDQYGVTRNVDITMRATNLTENEAGKKSNNLTVSGNDTTKIQLVGAELGDTFTLVLSAGSVSATTKVTVGADTEANIIATAGGASANNYRDNLLPVLV